jgi:hypothetical protein
LPRSSFCSHFWYRIARIPPRAVAGTALSTLIAIVVRITRVFIRKWMTVFTLEPRRMPKFSHCWRQATPDILAARDWFQVPRIHAATVAAEMIKLFAFWYRPAKSFKGVAMTDGSSLTR